ncbi:tetratricopeptide repeat protein [Crocosphaera sp. XPORK-15E]|uniref:tetratricopeptide repeat protein n=1 Tax=Crocosphaera sp. XPORK-15E TaxID=3110247 RepID=UPI002B1F02A3|nr:tetratricopeptide repeat protein [Crocosphaera sp. XPORK-15E]MEA5534048.1 tetratricopeptide repeat protein [Crocosphaera sp. XPORK-15E]
MQLENALKLNNDNNLTYQKLLSVIEASEKTLSLLIAVCDDRSLRDRIIKAYEKDLLPNLNSYHIRLDQNEPSLKAAINNIVQQEDFINSQKNAVLTVTGAEDLLFISHQGEKSQQDKFFGYLQWTREGLREFPYPIVLWVTNQILVNLTQKSPDFWSWRKGVFCFIPEPSLMTVSTPDNQLMFSNDSRETFSDSLSLEDLQELIANTEEKRGDKDPNLITLYNRLGEIYYNRLRRGEADNYPEEKETMLRCYYKALEIAERIGDKQGKASSSHNLGLAYKSLGQYQQAIQYYQQSLAIFTEINDCNGEANSYNNLGNAYYCLGQYYKAIEHHQKSLEILIKIEDKQGKASSYNNLGNAYKYLGQYQKAREYYQQSLMILQKTGDLHHQTIAYNNLGNIHEALGQYQQAIEYYQKSLSIAENIKDVQSQANSYNNLGSIYYRIKNYPQAIEYHEKSLTIFQKISYLPGETYAYGNLGNIYKALKNYQKAIEYYQLSLAIAQDIGDLQNQANSYNNLAIVYYELKNYQQAIQYHQKSLAIKTKIGDIRGKADTWFNLGLTFKKLKQKSEAVNAFNNARELYQKMELDSQVKDCDDELKILSN